jgi:hypothetical protein
MNIVIGVAAHRRYKTPDEDIYMPIQVGAYKKADIGYKRDDEGDNISSRNPQYCELTGLYWMWKNVEADYYGMVHYRRYFVNPHTLLPRVNSYDKILQSKPLENILKDYDVVLPHRRNYLIESVYSHYAHSHYAEHLDVTRSIIQSNYPAYLKAFDDVMKGTSAHMFNMMIMSKEKFDAYCQWLFPILFELESHIDISKYDAFQARYLGRVSELLVDVWVRTNNIRYKELSVVTIGKVRWISKIYSFLIAKFFGKKYRHGF